MISSDTDCTPWLLKWTIGHWRYLWSRWPHCFGNPFPDLFGHFTPYQSLPSLSLSLLSLSPVSPRRWRRSQCSGSGGAAEGVGGGGVSGRLSMIRVSKRQSRICSCVRRIHMDYLALAVEPLKDQRAIERKYFLIIMLDEPKKSAKQVCPCMLDELHLM